MGKADDRNNKIAKQARNAYENHKITKDNLVMWLIQKVGDDGYVHGEFATWIAACGRHLVVTGDTETVVFAYGPGKPRDLVRWMARGSGEYFGYPWEKASIGTGNDTMDEWDEECAREDLDELLAETQKSLAESIEEDGAESKWTNTYREMVVCVEEAIEALDENMGPWPVWSCLQEHDLLESAPSMVPASKLFYALAAVSKLDELLTEADEKEAAEKTRAYHATAEFSE